MRQSTFLVMWLMGALAMSCGAGGPAAGDGETAPVHVFIGALDESDAKIAFVHDDARWAAYVCGGAATMSSLTGWFQGDVSPAVGDRVGARSGGKELTVTFGDDGVTGTLVVDEAEPVRFKASLLAPRAPGGLYQVFSSGCRTGLIIPPSGHGEPQGVYCADVGPFDQRVRLFEQVTPVAPIEPDDAIVAARVLGASAKIIRLQKVALPLDST